MPLTITDDELRAMGMSPREAREEIACRVFDAGRVGFHGAMRLAGLDRIEFEQSLAARGIAIYRPTVDDLHEDLAALRRAGV